MNFAVLDTAATIALSASPAPAAACTAHCVRRFTNADWLGAVLVMFVILAIESALAVHLARARAGEVARTWKPRTGGLLLLAVLNPLPPLLAPIGLLLAWKSWRDGDDASVTRESA